MLWNLGSDDLVEALKDLKRKIEALKGGELKHNRAEEQKPYQTETKHLQCVPSSLCLFSYFISIHWASILC